MFRGERPSRCAWGTEKTHACRLGDSPGSDPHCWCVDATHRVVIVGAGFAGLNVAKILGGKPNVAVTVIDRRNHHLFQPLLYQVAMAGLSPAEIARPIRSLLAKHANVEVIEGEVTTIDRATKSVGG